MAARLLTPRQVRKPWGRRDLPAPFESVPADEEPVGEIWFEDPADQDRALLVKYLFTSERLSIQVHPDDEAARRAGHAHGKDEAWVVVEATADATIGLGLRRKVSREELRDAARDGSIEQLVDWRPVKAGDIYYAPAGTIHAIGAGLSVIEVQRNTDLTYRLYDYGRPRALQLDEAVEAACPAPYAPAQGSRVFGPGRKILVEGPFTLEQLDEAAEWNLEASPDDPSWLIAQTEGGTVDGRPLEVGNVWLVDGPAHLALSSEASVIVAYSGAPTPNRLIRS